ncbi:MAG: DUF3179 domain-containing protein [Planctomycetes bacterium]|nr:DUF3179 domain-containing protein [Planctomycetota bacterium]
MRAFHRLHAASVILASFAGSLHAQERDPSEEEFRRNARQVVERDAFPVFNNPEFVSAAQAETSGLVHDDAVVVGVTAGEIAKAYPIAVLGMHELGNDTLGDVPIAPSW